MKKLFLSVFASVTALTAMAGGHDAFWKSASQPYKGVTLNGVTENTPPGQFVSEVLAKDFEKLTLFEFFYAVNNIIYIIFFHVGVKW